MAWYELDRRVLGSKLPDERRRQLPKRSIIAQGLHPHPGPMAMECGFDDPEGPGWDKVEEMEDLRKHAMRMRETCLITWKALTKVAAREWDRRWQ